jgi:hypothetical protein
MPQTIRHTPHPRRLGVVTASRWSAPKPSYRARREEHALPIVFDEFRPANSLLGLLASRARLRFTGNLNVNQRWVGKLQLSSQRRPTP